MAMLPFAGYNVAGTSAALAQHAVAGPVPAKIFMVNWFRKNNGAKFLWPGYGDETCAC